ncbi:MAG: DNA polymerase III subunit beta [Flavobacteriales bacterium]|nr:DNA polymerase III subunit beta [Flavobacteriales bacterium]
MKFIVSSSALLKQLQGISGVLSNSNTLPILDHFLFKFEGDSLELSASDLETTMTSTLTPEKVDGEGSVAIPARLLLDTLKTFPEQPLNFDIDDKTFGIEISSDSGKYKLAGQNGQEFPKLPELEDTSTMDIEAGVLQGAIHKTLFAAGNDELRPVMSGVLFELGESDLTFVATDAHKLVKCKRSDTKSSKAASIIIPKKPLNLLKGILSTNDEKVTVTYNNTNVHFAFDNMTLICRLIEGKYPNYDAVIPKENPNKLTIDRQSLLNSIKRVSVFSNKTTHQVRLKVAGSELNISAEDLDFQNEAKERLTCQYEGEDMEIGFNSRFLLEMLQNLQTDNVNIEMSAPNRAGILLPSEADDKDEDLLMLVMPVMLNN